MAVDVGGLAPGLACPVPYSSSARHRRVGGVCALCALRRVLRRAVGGVCGGPNARLASASVCEVRGSGSLGRLVVAAVNSRLHRRAPPNGTWSIVTCGISDFSVVDQPVTSSFLRYALGIVCLRGAAAVWYGFVHAVECRTVLASRLHPGCLSFTHWL